VDPVANSSHDVAPVPPATALVPAASAADAAGSDAQPSAGATTEAVDAGPATAAGELGNIISANGGGAVGLIAALLAVVGGTAGFKLWTKISEQKHEQSMKKLDIDQANAGLQGAQPPPCQTAHQALLADIKAIKASLAEQDARLSKAEKASAGFDPSVDVGDLEDRVEALEKSFRKKARSTGGE
jgi:hypothetical protein